MLRLDSRVSLMVATEEHAETIDAILKKSVLILRTSDDEDESSGFFVIVLDEDETHAEQAREILDAQ